MNISDVEKSSLFVQYIRDWQLAAIRQQHPPTPGKPLISLLCGKTAGRTVLVQKVDTVHIPTSFITTFTIFKQQLQCSS